MAKRQSKYTNVQISIANRPYKLKVAEAEKASVMLAVKLIEQKIQELQRTYGVSDKQDSLAMAALLICVELLQKGHTNAKDTNYELKRKLDKLDKVLTEFLKKK